MSKLGWAALFALSGCALPTFEPLAAELSSEESFARALIDSYRAWAAAEHPVESSLSGNHAYDHTFGGLSAADCDRRMAALQEYRADVDALQTAGLDSFTRDRLDAIGVEIEVGIGEERRLKRMGGFDPRTIEKGLRVLMSNPSRARALACRLLEAAPMLRSVPAADSIIQDLEIWFARLVDPETRRIGIQALQVARSSLAKRPHTGESGSSD